MPRTVHTYIRLTSNETNKISSSSIHLCPALQTSSLYWPSAPQKSTPPGPEATLSYYRGLRLAYSWRRVALMRIVRLQCVSLVCSLMLLHCLLRLCVLLISRSCFPFSILLHSIPDGVYDERESQDTSNDENHPSTGTRTSPEQGKPRPTAKSV